MSESPVTENSVPFVASTTPTIERANRLLGLRSHPGFLDLVRIGQDLVQEASDACRDFGGWDPQMIVVLKSRQQAAYEYHQHLLTRITTAIETGLEEARALSNSLPEKSPEEIVETGDLVRQKLLEKFEQMAQEDNRPAGSY